VGCKYVHIIMASVNQVCGMQSLSIFMGCLMSHILWAAYMFIYKGFPESSIWVAMTVRFYGMSQGAPHNAHLYQFPHPTIL